MVKVKVRETHMSATIQFSLYDVHVVIKCWKIIGVMSNQFAESEWCQWEIDLVQERRRRQGKKALVLIMYRQIDSRHMTS
jgi:hypothetical protein